MAAAAGQKSGRWLVHVEWMDGAQDEVVGDPNVSDGVLVVTVAADDDLATAFEAQYPLANIRVWWCDYDGEDRVLANARGRRARTVHRPVESGGGA